VIVNIDGDVRVNNTNNPLQRLKLASAAGRFNPGAVNNSGFNFTTESNTLLDLQQTSTSINDLYDIGDVLPAGLTASQLTQDLTLQFNVKGGGLGLKTADVVVPEPSTLALVGIGAGALLARRRKRSR